VIAVTSLPTGPAGRALALTILGAAIAVVYIGISAPLLSMYQQGDATLNERRLLIPKVEFLAQEVPTLRARLADLKAAGAARGVTLEGTSDALASANLQNYLEQLAAANGVAIASTEAIAAEDRGAYRRIGLRLVVNGKYAPVVRLLGAIEEAKPPLVLSNLQIHGLTRGVEVRTDYPLDTRFEVSGLRTAETAASAK
jgi:hypothetical protein